MLLRTTIIAMFLVMFLAGPSLAEIYCSGICMDVTADNIVNESDFLALIGGIEQLLDECPWLAFNGDGYVDSYDIVPWDWSLHPEGRLNLCDGWPPFTGDSSSGGSFNSSGISIRLDSLLVAGKRGTSDGPTKLKDRLYVLDGQGQYVDYSEPVHEHTSSKLLIDPNGGLYQINMDNGLVRLSNGNSVIPPGTCSVSYEPRYGLDAQVHLGLHQEQDEDWWGRAITDAAFDSAGYVYVLPVVVDPNGAHPDAEPYTAAAKLELLDEGNPPYNVIQLYDDPNATDPNDDRNLNGLREIDLDNSGNVYVVNAYNTNESDTLWVYDPNGTMQKRITLSDSNSTSYIPSAIALHVSNKNSMVYLASAINNPDANSTLLYVVSKDELMGCQNDPNFQSIIINNMGHITGITENPANGEIWVVGFTNVNIPEFPNPNDPPFYHPYLAKINNDSNNTEAVCIDANDLALPLSILWTDDVKCADTAKLYIKDSSDEAVAWLGNLGNVVLKGTLTEETTPTASGDDEFRFQDPNGTDVAIIDANDGNMYIAGSLYEDQSMLDPQGDNNFIIKDSNDIVVAYIDDPNGNMYLTGWLYENSNP